MKKLIDLHTHTTISDGSMTPDELVKHAKDIGLSAVSITDHDSIDGISSGLAAGEKYGIEVIPGIEISVDYMPEMHLLGFFSESNYRQIDSLLEVLRRSRDERNPKILEKLYSMGLKLTYDEVKEAAEGKIIARPHIAKVMVIKGYVKSINEAFERYLSAGRPAYVKKDKLTPQQGIKEIIEAGGVPVLAHPKFLNKTVNELDKLLFKLKAYGLAGIEAIYSENTATETGNILRLAIKHGLLATGGSDFHGSYKEGLELGVGRGNLEVPYELLEKLKSSIL